MESWSVTYEDRAGVTRTVESRSALDAAKDFALLVPRGDDCAVVVSPLATPGESVTFDRRRGIFEERVPSPPVPPVTGPAVPPPPAAAVIMTPPVRPGPGGDTFSYRGWLISDSFLKRCFAVVGYAAVGHALIAIAVWLIILGALGSCVSLVHFFSAR